MRSKKFGFSICLMTTTFKVYEIIGARMEGNILLRRHQYEYTENDIGRKIEQNKIFNQKKCITKNQEQVRLCKRRNFIVR